MAAGDEEQIGWGGGWGGVGVGGVYSEWIMVSYLHVVRETVVVSWVSNCPVSKCPVSSCPVSSCPGFVRPKHQSVLSMDFAKNCPTFLMSRFIQPSILRSSILYYQIF